MSSSTGRTRNGASTSPCTSAWNANVSFGHGEKPKVSSRIAWRRVTSARMTPAERYILLGLRLGRHVDGLVDSYYGPAELKEQTDAEDVVPPEELAAEGAALLAELEESWLRDLVQGLDTYARVLAGEPISYSDEVERCYGVRPARIDRSVYEATL